jgi:hypothetical protein
MERNPYDRTTQGDPCPTHRWMSDHAPLCHCDTVGLYALTRSDEVTGGTWTRPLSRLAFRSST